MINTMTKKTERGMDHFEENLGKRLIESPALLDKAQLFTHLEKTYSDLLDYLKSHDLAFSQGEIRHLMLLKCGWFNSNEIAKALGIGRESLKTYRYQLKVKLALDKDESLTDYLKRVEKEFNK